MCVDSIVLPYGSLAFISLFIIKGAIFGVAYLSRCIFVMGSTIAIMVVIFGSGGASTLFIKTNPRVTHLVLLTIAQWIKALK